MVWISSPAAGYVVSLSFLKFLRQMIPNMLLVCLTEDPVLLQIRTHFARPNWRKVFSDLASAHKNSRIGEQPSRFGQHISTQGQQLIRSYIQVFSIVDLQRSQNNSRIFRKNSARQPRLGSISTKKTSKIMYNRKFANRLQIYLYRKEYGSIWDSRFSFKGFVPCRVVQSMC
jgi:hypothetical protein